MKFEVGDRLIILGNIYTVILDKDLTEYIEFRDIKYETIFVEDLEGVRSFLNKSEIEISIKEKSIKRIFCHKHF